MRRAIALAFALGLAAPAAHALEARTDELMWMCEGRASGNEVENFGKQAQCIGFIDGIVDANAMMKGFLGVQLFCPPPGGISLDQAMRIFLKWANDHPEELRESARISVTLSLVQAFPCAR